MSTQVTINDVPPKTQITATGGQTVFTTNWTANAASDVVVYARTSAQEPDDLTQLVSSANYTVAFIGGSEIVEITFLVARASGDVITITRDTPADRLNLYTNTNFTPSMLNQDVGILTLVDQQAQLYNEQVAPHYNVSATPDLGDSMTGEGGDIYLPVLEANQIWAKNNANTAIEAYNVPSGTGLAPRDATYILQTPWSPGTELPNSQPLSPLATGFMASVTGTGVVSTRTLQGTANQINVTNGAGTGNPVFSLSSALLLPGTMTFGGNVDANGFNISNIGQANIGNIQISGNTIESTDTNGNLILTPDGTGDLVLDGLNWPQVDGLVGQAVTTDGAGQLGWSTVSTVTTPTTDKAIAIFNGTSGALQNSSITIPASNILSGVGQIDGINGEPVLVTNDAVNAVNYFNFYSQIAGSTPLFGVNGTDANIGMTISTKGTGAFGIISESSSNQITMYTGTSGQHNTNFQFPTTLANQTVTFPDLTGTVALSGSGQSVSFGELDVDNIEINGNTISSTDTNGDLILTPNGTGDLVLDNINWPQADGSSGQVISTNGSGQLGWSTVSTVTTPTIDQRIARFNGTGGALEDSLVSIDDAGIVSGATQLNVDNLRLDGNTITSTNTNGNIQLNANGTGQVEIDDPGLETGGILVDGASFETTFRVNDIGGAAPAQMILHKHSTTWEPIILSARSNSNTSAHATVTAGMPVLNIYGTGWLNSYYGTMASITFSADATGTIADGSAPGRLQFNVTPDGALLPVEAMRINNNGVVTLANALPIVSGGTGLTSTPTNGQLLIGNGSGYTLATLTAGAGISIANAAGSITISGTGSGIGWTEVTGTTQAMAADNGYVSNNAAQVVFTLPVTAAFGTVINLVGKGAGGWKIAQNASQNIQLGSTSSTVGATGYIESTNRYDSIELLCTTANTTWTVLGGPQGNITVA